MEKPTLKLEKPGLPASWLKFIHGQQLFWSLRITLGSCIPALWLMVPMHLPTQGMAAGVGAVCIGLLDLPGTLRAKHREMLACALAVLLSCGLTALSLQHGSWNWLSVVFISAAGAYALNFGLKASMIGLVSVVVMAMAQSLHGAPSSMMLAYLQGLAIGCFWYIYFSLLVCWVLRHQMHQRALADCLFVTASHFRARADCYAPELTLGQTRQILARSQNLLQQAQQQARDLVLGELCRQQAETLNAKQYQLFNLFADIINMYDLVTAAHTDFALLRRHPAPVIQLQLRDFLLHGAGLLERIAAAVSLERQIPHLCGKTSRLRELEASLAALEQAQPEHPALATLKDSVLRMGQLRRLVAKTVRDTRSKHNTSGLDVTQVLNHYRSPVRLFTPPQSWISGPAPAYALRLALAMLLALFAAQLSGSSHGSWIVLTVAVALRPGFGLSRQRGIKRVQGTLAGCAAGLGILSLVNEPHLLLLLTIICLMLSLGLSSIEYLVSAFFTSVMVVLMYHLTLPADTQVAQLRLLDTAIGAAIALGMTYVAPYWEYRRILPLCRALLADTRRYLQCLQQLQPQTVIDFRAARRSLLSSLAVVSASHDSMLLDPVNKQYAVKQLQSLLLWGHLLVSLGNTLALRLQQGSDPEADAEIQQALALLVQTGDPLDCASPTSAEQSVRLAECAMRMQQLSASIEQQLTPLMRT